MSQASRSLPQAVSNPPLWVDNDATLGALIGQLSSVDEVAIDTEFHRERTYYPRLALIQMAWREGCALIDPLAVETSLLAELFIKERLFVFHAFEQDLAILERAVGDIPPNLFDTQIASGFLGFSRPGLSVLLERYLGIRIPKADRLSDWTLRPLRSAQLSYAAADVFHLLDLKEVMTGELAAKGRLGWTHEETALQASKPKLPTVPMEAWLRIKECRGLKGDSRKIAQHVAAWREHRAMSLDIPPRFLISDLAVASISQARPRTPGDLVSVRGVEMRRLGGGMDVDLINAINEGLAAPSPPELPPHESSVPKGSAPLIGLCTTWVSAKAQHEHLDSALVASREDVTEFLFSGRGRLAEGWRFDLLGREVQDIRDGRCGVIVNSEGALTLSYIPAPPISGP